MRNSFINFLSQRKTIIERLAASILVEELTPEITDVDRRFTVRMEVWANFEENSIGVSFRFQEVCLSPFNPQSNSATSVMPEAKKISFQISEDVVDYRTDHHVMLYEQVMDRFRYCVRNSKAEYMPKVSPSGQVFQTAKENVRRIRFDVNH